jgi:hypothetical protein
MSENNFFHVGIPSGSWIADRSGREPIPTGIHCKDYLSWNVTMSLFSDAWVPIRFQDRPAACSIAGEQAEGHVSQA